VDNPLHGRMVLNHGIPVPEFPAHPDWFSVTFAKDFQTKERLVAVGLSLM